MMWSRTDLTPADLDMAQLYDGFTYHTLAWLRSMGICDHADAAAFVEGGKRIAIEGEMPINTGEASSRPGACMLMVSCIGLHPVVGARRCAASARRCRGERELHGGPLAGCMLLVRE